MKLFGDNRGTHFFGAFLRERTFLFFREDADVENDTKRTNDGKNRARQMLEDYESLKATLDDEQKILLDKYCASYQNFMFGVCDTAYESGYNDALETKAKRI